jgi:hypothetical protein
MRKEDKEKKNARCGRVFVLVDRAYLGKWNEWSRKVIWANCRVSYHTSDTFKVYYPGLAVLYHMQSVGVAIFSADQIKNLQRREAGYTISMDTREALTEEHGAAEMKLFNHIVKGV